MTTANKRSAEHPIDKMFLERWSARAFTGAEISQSDLLTILEAARWAPSASNLQPWRFIYARRETEHWQPLFDLLVPFNQSWAHNAAALIVIASETTYKAAGSDALKPAYSHSFDAGAAWQSLALQATRMGWSAHGMIGFDTDGAPAKLGIPQGFRVEAAVAIGRPGDPSVLPEALKAREVPSTRRPLNEIAFEGHFPTG
ncbi:MAG: nitroreductase family protein [Hyphomicrobiaceae bacterium]|nr:nitroreductase family protein [Hyphomicrobiaceae bacterium]